MAWLNALSLRKVHHPRKPPELGPCEIFLVDLIIFSSRPLRMGRRIPISPMLRFGHGPVIPPTFKGIRPLHNGFTGILPPRPRIRVGGVMRRGSASRGL